MSTMLQTAAFGSLPLPTGKAALLPEVDVARMATNVADAVFNQMTPNEAAAAQLTIKQQRLEQLLHQALGGAFQSGRLLDFTVSSTDVAIHGADVTVGNVTHHAVVLLPSGVSAQNVPPVRMT